jgi:hypothetical protein
MQTSNKAQLGVGYYNVDNKDNENNVCVKDPAMHNDFVLLSSGIEAYASLDTESNPAMPLQAKPQYSQCNSQPTPFHQDQIKRAIFQFFDNSATSVQRYKFKLRLNLDDNTNPEFVASLTKDMRNFRKHIPAVCKDDLIHFANQIRKNVKLEYGVYPWLGKLHLNQGRGRNIHSQIEPHTAVAIWWDQENNGWSGVLMFHDWIKEFDLFGDYLTDAQKKKNVKAQDLWVNPKHDVRIRPKTWAELRAGK